MAPLAAEADRESTVDGYAGFLLLTEFSFPDVLDVSIFPMFASLCLFAAKHPPPPPYIDPIPPQPTPFDPMLRD